MYSTNNRYYRESYSKKTSWFSTAVLSITKDLQAIDRCDSAPLTQVQVDSILGQRGQCPLVLDVEANAAIVFRSLDFSKGTIKLLFHYGAIGFVGLPHPPSLSRS